MMVQLQKLGCHNINFVTPEHVAPQVLEAVVPAELSLSTAPSVAGATSRGAIPYPATLSEISAAAANAALKDCDGNKSAAARELGISRARLQRLLDREEDDGE
jgi:DNA-binding NtrC family response regulator